MQCKSREALEAVTQLLEVNAKDLSRLEGLELPESVELKKVTGSYQPGVGVTAEGGGFEGLLQVDSAFVGGSVWDQGHACAHVEATVKAGFEVGSSVNVMLPSDPEAFRNALAARIESPSAREAFEAMPEDGVAAWQALTGNDLGSSVKFEVEHKVAFQTPWDEGAPAELEKLTYEVKMVGRSGANRLEMLGQVEIRAPRELASKLGMELPELLEVAREGGLTREYLEQRGLAGHFEKKKNTLQYVRADQTGFKGGGVEAWFERSAKPLTLWDATKPEKERLGPEMRSFVESLRQSRERTWERLSNVDGADLRASSVMEMARGLRLRG